MVTITSQPTFYSYVATAGQTSFPVTCRIFDNYLDDFEVKKNGVVMPYNAAAATSSQWKSVQAGGGAEGGNIVFGAGLAAGDLVTVRRTLPLDRVSDFPTTGPVDMADVNAEFSRLLALIQDAYAGILPGSFPFASGNWTPTVSVLSNCSAVTIDRAMYSRMGAIVTCTVIGTMTVTGAGVTQFRLSPPVASAMTSSNDAIGVGVHQSGDAFPIGINASQGDDTIQIAMYPAAGGSRGFKLTFQYEVK